MEKREEIKRLVDAGFKESDEWSKWYFDNVYDDNDAMLAYSAGLPVSCLMLSQYRLKLNAEEVNMGYISCATTARQARGHGHMSRLINDALMEASHKGDAIVSLIPASRRLFFYYDRFNFSTIFYDDIQRYTSRHQFHADVSFIEVQPTYSDFHRLETLAASTVIHSQRDFDNIIADNCIDGGIVIAIAGTQTGTVQAMLFATLTNHTVRIKAIFSENEKATEAIFYFLRKKVGERMFIVYKALSDDPLDMHSRAMGRITNATLLLKAIAAQSPLIEQVIRLHDKLIPDNNGIYIIHNGTVERTNATMRRISLDVPVDTFAKIIFNSKRIGETFGLPTFRPTMPLMLE